MFANTKNSKYLYPVVWGYIECRPVQNKSELFFNLFYKQPGLHYFPEISS